VLVVERVIDAAALPPAANDAHRPHQAQLVRHRGLADPDLVRQLVDAEVALGERVDDADPGGVAEDAEGIGERLDGGGVLNGGRSGGSLHI